MITLLICIFCTLARIIVKIVAKHILHCKVLFVDSQVKWSAKSVYFKDIMNICLLGIIDVLY